MERGLTLKLFPERYVISVLQSTKMHFAYHEKICDDICWVKTFLECTDDISHYINVLMIILVVQHSNVLLAC
jgi:hypothetical protein